MPFEPTVNQVRIRTAPVEPPPRQNEGHVSVDWGDGHKYNVYLDGIKVTYRTKEAIAGNPGKVLMYDLNGEYLVPLKRWYEGNVVVETIDE